MKIVKTRALISLVLMVAFSVVLFTGIGLYFSPAGRVAYATGWTFFGLQKMQLEKLHTVAGFVMAGSVLVHLFVNFKMFLGEAKVLFK